MSLKPIEKLKRIDSEDHLSWKISEGNIVDKMDELIEVVNEQSEVIKKQQDLLFGLQDLVLSSLQLPKGAFKE